MSGSSSLLQNTRPVRKDSVLYWSKEFKQHDPELFALYACLAIVMSCATVVGFVVPVTLHPLVMPGVPIAISVLLSRAMASFHRRA